MKRITNVAFASQNLEKAYNSLKEGKFEDNKLYDFIMRAKKDLKINPNSGIRIPTRLIPKEYLQKYGINNLWKYNLPNAWRLLYSIIGDEIKIVAMILDWMNHKDYERLFKF